MRKFLNHTAPETGTDLRMVDIKHSGEGAVLFNLNKRTGDGQNKMETIQDIKKEKENKVNELITACLMFFAFSTEQFNENKTPKAEDEKYVHLGAGAYLPKSKVNDYISGIENINAWYKAEVKDNKARRQNITYELNNHEAYYTGDIKDTLSALGNDYTAEEVQKVFNEEEKTQSVEY